MERSKSTASEGFFAGDFFSPSSPKLGSRRPTGEDWMIDGHGRQAAYFRLTRK
jgi:hypothetical protein